MGLSTRYLIIDTYNLIHRARGGFQKGDWPVVFNFFRSLRPLVEQHPADELLFVLEGHPRANVEAIPGYKANRPPAPPEFLRQKDAVIRLLQYFPCRIFQHPDYEADDVVGALTTMLVRQPREAGAANSATIVSSDSDFLQLLRSDDGVRLWNWREGSFMTAPDFDYVRWKSLRGDPTDNIPRVPGMNDETALAVVRDASRFDALMADPMTRALYERNERAIMLHAFSEEELDDIVYGCIEGERDWDEVRRSFELYGFQSMLNEKTWCRYVETFGGL